MKEHTLTITAPQSEEYDVVVCGGGPAGVAAAIAASRAQARVLLVEQTGCLGGAGTNGLVGVWLGSFTRDQQQKVIAGIFQEIVDLLVAEGAAIRAEDDVPSGSRHVGYGAIHGRTVPFLFEPCKRVLESLCRKEGVTLRYFTTAVQPQVHAGRIDGVFLHGKSGFSYVGAKAVVDATGDADIVYRSGCPVRKGRDTDGLMSPGTLIFLVEDVDCQSLEDYFRQTQDVRLRHIISRLKQNQQWPFAFDALVLCETPRRGTLFVNGQLQLGLDGTDEVSMTDGIVQARGEAAELMRLLQKHVPGFSAARMTTSAAVIGVRETRRIVGTYTLTVADARGESHFDDTIALTGFGWDLGDPKIPSKQAMFGTDFGLPYTEIPYRTLVPRGIDNLIAAGRCLSVERDVLGPVRIQPACFATGQAAGMAAAWVAQYGIPFARIDTAKLRASLTSAGAITASDAQCDEARLQGWIRQHLIETGHIPPT